MIAYFLKRTISLVDSCAKDIKELSDNKTSKKKFASFRTDVNSKVEKLSHDIECIRRITSPRKTFFVNKPKPTANLT